MAVYRIADFNIALENRYPHITRQCAAYAAPEGTVPDLTVAVSEEELRASIATRPEFSPGYHESICMYRRLCTVLLPRGAFLMHAAVVETGGRAYAFSARSGTGKSTHISLWHRVYGDAVTVINGDKPLLRQIDGTFYAYGTPWCGKEGWNTNRRAPLSAICFLERSETNRIRPLSADEAVERIFHQLLRPREAAEMDMTLSLTDALLRAVPVYLLGCNISEEAARLSYETLTGTKKEN